ncbi:uncharacterized protein PY1_contig_09_14 [Novosphingobium sp. PY1]|nr:uncharacterized protein PY1_contig_09_14 [Novosphingobium sp. PY1]
MRHADIKLAEGAARASVSFTQSIMSNDPMEDVARVANLLRWWQLHVFGGAEVWQELVNRAARIGCEALVLTSVICRPIEQKRQEWPFYAVASARRYHQW